MRVRSPSILKSALGWLATAAFIAGLAYFMVQIFAQRDTLREITPDIGMTKTCTQDAEGAVHCTQAPTAPTAPPAPDPNAPMFVTLGPAE